MVKVSVVMGVYLSAANAWPMLRTTLDSILNQTFSDFEVLIVDDGSVEPVVVDDPRVRVIRKYENRGLTRALMDGCAAAQGEYIARHDVGDVSHPSRLERQVALLDANDDVAFVSCQTQFAGPEGEPLYVVRGRTTKPTSILDPGSRHGVVDGPTSHGSVMFRRSAYERAGGYRAAFYYGQDWDLWYRLAAVGEYQNAGEVLYEMRVMPDGISASARGAQLELARLSEEAMRARLAGRSEGGVLVRAAAVGKRRKPRFSRARGLYFIGEALRRNRDRRSRRYFVRAIASCPLLPKPWLRLLQTFLTR